MWPATPSSNPSLRVSHVGSIHGYSSIANLAQQIHGKPQRDAAFCKAAHLPMSRIWGLSQIRRVSHFGLAVAQPCYSLTGPYFQRLSRFRFAQGTDFSVSFALIGES